MCSLHPHSTYVIPGHTCMLPVAYRCRGALYTLDLKMYTMVILVVFRYYGLAQAPVVISGNLADFVITQSITRGTLKQPWTEGADENTTNTMWIILCNFLYYDIYTYKRLIIVALEGILTHVSFYPNAIYLLKSACIAVPASQFFSDNMLFQGSPYIFRWIIFLFLLFVYGHSFKTDVLLKVPLKHSWDMAFMRNELCMIFPFTVVHVLISIWWDDMYVEKLLLRWTTKVCKMIG